MYVGKNYKVTESFGIFYENMVCSCFSEDELYCWMWFKNPVIGMVHQIKVRKTLMNYFKEI